jgi:hypothetical protein
MKTLPATKRPAPLTRAGTLINSFQALYCRKPKELSIMFCRIQRRNYWFWQDGWRYWNKVLQHVKQWEG